LIFSNLTTPNNIYGHKIGNIKDTLDYLIKYCLMPFDDQTVSIFKIFEELIDWHWGFSNLMRIGDFLTFVLDWSKKLSKSVVEAKYTFVEKVINSAYFKTEMSLISEVTRKGLLTYY